MNKARADYKMKTDHINLNSKLQVDRAWLDVLPAFLDICNKAENGGGDY
jgi:hypothetical protein